MEPIPQELVDRFGRQVSFLRLSVTDRCDFRCVYCMAEDMVFVPRSEVLSLEELYRVAKAFTALGVRGAFETRTTLPPRAVSPR